MYEPPYGPADLAAPAKSGEEFLASLEEQRQQKYPGLPALYAEIVAGNLTLDAVQFWAKDMYFYWEYALRYSTGAVFIKTNDEPTRTHMLRKLVDIEGEELVNDLTGWTTPAYDELWLRFGEGIGISRSDMATWKPFTRSYFADMTLCTYSRWWEWSWIDGIASFLAGDETGLANLAPVHDALKSHYKVSDDALEFFRVFIEDCESHIPWEKEALSYWACTTERQLSAARAYRYRLDIEDQRLVAAHTAATTEFIPLQVPRDPATLTRM